MRRLQDSLTTIYDWMHDMFTAWGSVVRGDPALSAPPPADDDDELLEDEPYAETVEHGADSRRPDPAGEPRGGRGGKG